jgi:hypothetical protein
MAEEMKTVDFNLDSSEDQTAPTEEMTTVDFNLESAEKPTDSEKMTTVDIDLTNNESNTYEGWLTESAEGVVEGLTKIPQGILELGLDVYDYANDTHHSRQFNLWADETRKKMGIDPEGLAGGLASGITQFAVPGIGAAVAVSKISKLGKLAKIYDKTNKRRARGSVDKPELLIQKKLTKSQKLALGTQQAVGAGIADAVVTTDGTQTIGDFFDGGFTGTDVYDVANTGVEDASRRLTNRFSMFIEGGALAGTLPPVLSGAGKLIVKTGAARVPGTTITGADITTLGSTRAFGAIVKKASEKIAKLDDKSLTKGLIDEQTGQRIEQSRLEKFGSSVVAALRSRGYLPGVEKGVKDVKGVDEEKIITLLNKETDMEFVNANGEVKKYKSETEAFIDLDEYSKSLVRQDEEWQNIQKKRSNDPDNEAADSALIDEQKILEQQKFQEVRDMFKAQVIKIPKSKKFVEGTEETIDLPKLFSLTGPIQEAALKVAERQMKNLNKALDKVMDKREFVEQSNLTRQKILNNIYDYFTGSKIINILPKSRDGKALSSVARQELRELGITSELIKPIREMVILKNNLAEQILKSGAVKNLLTRKQILKQPFRQSDKFIKAAKARGDVSEKPDWFKGSSEATAKKEWTEQQLDEAYLKLKKGQGVASKEEIIDAIEQSIIKPDGSNTDGFFQRRYRIFEDKKYEVTDAQTENVMNMLGWQATKGSDGKIVKDSDGNIEYGLILDEKGLKLGFNENTMQNIYMDISKVFNRRLVVIEKNIKRLEETGQVVPQKTLDEKELLQYKAVNELKTFAGPPSPKQIKKYIDLVHDFTKSKKNSTGTDMVYRAPIKSMPTTLINARRIDLPTLREIYGEVKSLRESYVGTITKMSEFNAIDDFYSKFRKVADSNIVARGIDNSIYYDTSRLSRDELKNWLNTQKENGREWYVLGRSDLSGSSVDDIDVTESPFGSMHGMAIPKVMWKSLSQHVVNDSTEIGNLGRQMLGGLLWLKGLSQYSKTILSPITHVRNLTSAAAFAMAQGNIGRGANLLESVRLVALDVVNRGDDGGLAYLAKLQKMGVIGSQAELRELQANLRKGVGYETPIVRRDAESLAEKPAKELYGNNPDPIMMDKLSEKNMVFNFSSGIGKKTNKALKFMEDAYKGEDDIWKIYNYEFELNKLRTARAKSISRARNSDEAKLFAKQFDEDHLQGKSMEDYAGDNVRNLVPNYDLTSETIKAFRKLPIGNFVSFPAEIMRTGFNTLESAVKELSSEVPEIREIGMRRLMGALTTFVALPMAIREMGMSLTGTSEKEMQAVQDLSAPWQKNSTLVPVGRDKNGHLEVYDFSYTNPYGVLIKPFTAALRSLDRDGKLEKGVGTQLVNASWESFGELFAPFTDESIITEKLLDVLPEGFPLARGGITKTGSKVYRTGEGGDTQGDKVQKAFVHLLEGLTPGASPFRVPIGSKFEDYELGRFLRGTISPGSKEPSTGRQYGRGGEILRAIIGINTQTYDWDRLGKFKANEFKENRSSAAGQYNRVINRSVVTKDDIIEAWKDANDARLRSFRAGRKDFLALQALGATEDQIIERWKKENVGNTEIGAIISNTYVPFFPSDKSFLTAAEKEHDIPIEELEALYYQFESMPIETEETEEVDFNLSEVMNDANNEPVTTEVPKTPVAQTSQVSPVARDINTRLATLLNPNDRIIAERQRNIG